MPKEEISKVAYPNWLDRSEYPFTPHYFELSMGKMHYVDQGSGDAVVMVHGNPTWSYIYRNEIKALSAKYRCIAPDLIGFGLSDKPVDWTYLPEQHAANLDTLLEHLNLKNITLIVNDWGGPIGLSYAIKHPEKIKKLIILNTWMWDVKNDMHYRVFSGIMGGAWGRFMIKYFNFFAKVVVKRAFGDKSKLTKSVHNHLCQHLAVPAHRKGCYVFPKEIIDSGSWLDQLWNHKDTINQIETTFVWGMKDIAFREKELNYWIKNWGKAKVIRLEEMGHFPQEEAPDTIISEFTIH